MALITAAAVCCSAADTTSVEVSSVASVDVSPTSASMAAGSQQTFQALAFDANGNSASPSGVSWSSSNTSVATVSSTGVVTAVANGSAIIRASLSTLSDSATVSVAGASAPAPSGSVHPNQPSGFTEIVENPFDVKVPSGWDLYYHGGDLQIIYDSTAPGSPSNVARVLFPAGFVGGGGPISLQYAGWQAADMYIDFWFKVSTNWQGHVSGVNKIFYLDDNSSGYLYLAAVGAGSNPLTFQVRSQGTPMGAVNYAWNAPGNQVSVRQSDAQVVRGKWCHIEVLIKTNTPGSYNGELTVWINGKKTHAFTGQAFVPATSDGRFDQIKWGPVWGGGNIDTILHDQYQFMENFYLSGAG